MAISRALALVCDASGEISWADERAATILSLNPGASLLDSMVGDSREKCLAFLAAARLGRTRSWELVMLARGETTVFDCVGLPFGDEIMIDATCLPATHSGAIAEMSALLGELAQLQRETQQQQREAQQLNLQLERERRLLSGVLDQMSSGVLVVDARTRQELVANATLKHMLDSAQNHDDTDTTIAIDLPEFDLARLIDTFERSDTLIETQVRVAQTDGSDRVLQLTVSPVRDRAGVMLALVGVVQDVTVMTYRQEQLQRDSLHDALTGLPNRRMLELQLERALAAARRNATTVALMFLDLDGFKQINDTLGHQAGDSVLQETARRLAATIRSEDTAVRLAGDEFVVLIESVRDLRAATTTAMRLLQSLGKPFHLDGSELIVVPSIGIALSEAGALDGDMLLTRADSAMYRAKRAGGGGYDVH